MITLTTYKTIDGEVFTNEIEALRHENQILHAQVNDLSVEHDAGIKKNKSNSPVPKITAMAALSVKQMAYQRFINSCALGYWTPIERKHEIVPYEDFCAQIDSMGKFAEAKKSFYNLRLKSVRYHSMDNLNAKCISVMPLEFRGIIGNRKSDENRSTLSSSCIRKTPEDGYMYSFTSSHSGNVPIAKCGFNSARAAYLSLLRAKTTIARNMAKKKREYIDEESYNILNSLTYYEAERIFFPSKDKMLFSENDIIGKNIVKSL